jgi:hypothetical protein
MTKNSNTKLIPAAKALIGFYLGHGSRVTRVFVIEDGRGTPTWDNGAPEEWHTASRTYGACFTDWLGGDHEQTPEWIFSEIIAFHGCADSRVMEEAIREFAKIEECGWARAMTPLVPHTGKPFWSRV